MTIGQLKDELRGKHAKLSGRKADLVERYVMGRVIIYIIIRHCPGVGAFPRPFCVPNSVALASLTLQVGDWAIH